MSDAEPVLGNDGLTNAERALHLAAFQTGIGSKSPEVPAAVALLTRAAAEEATAIERAAWTARVEAWAALLESESPVGVFIAAEARTRLITDDGTAALDAVKAAAVRDALLDASGSLPATRHREKKNDPATLAAISRHLDALANVTGDSA